MRREGEREEEKHGRTDNEELVGKTGWKRKR